MTPVLPTEDGADHEFDVLYPMLGETTRSDLAVALGADTADCMELVVDAHQQTCVPGLYAIGDVVRGLNQISVAAGHAAVAATRIHNTERAATSFRNPSVRSSASSTAKEVPSQTQ